MSPLLTAWTAGLLLALLALGVFISYRIFSFPDITVDGSFTLGGAVAAALLTGRPHDWLAAAADKHLWPAGWVPAASPADPLAATAAAVLCGVLAGAATGVLHTRFKINALLSGILVMTALYSVNLRVMGKSNIPLLSAPTVSALADRLGAGVLGGADKVHVRGWVVTDSEAGMLVLAAATVALIGCACFAFFRTDLGTAMRATGDNDQMIRALGVNVENMTVAGLALSNGLVALSGALFAQYQGYADVQMGIGMVVRGLASVIIGEALVGSRALGLTVTGTVLGSLLFSVLIALVLRAGLDANDMKLLTAAFVFAALVLPRLAGRLGARRKGAAGA
jgi:putative ABC transport system permease protein